jgi:hypothetical protein
MNTISDRIARIVREWPDWSPAERRRMDAVVEEVLHHCRTDEGNAFIREWCEGVLRPILDAECRDSARPRCPLCGNYSPGNANVRLIAAEPDLLATLEVIANKPIGTPEATHREVLNAIVGLARDAIAKARGES